MGFCRALSFIIVASLLLGSCSKGFGAQTSVPAETVQQVQALASLQIFSIIDIRIVRTDGAILDFTDRPIPTALNIVLTFSRGLRVDERAQFEREFALLDDETTAVSGRMEWSADGTELTFTPAGDLDFERTYTISNINPVGMESSFKTMTCGDVNGDGRTDFIIGAPGAGNGMGKAFVYSGSAPSGPTMAEVAGDSIGDRTGRWVAAAGDINDDGYADVIVAEGDEHGLAHDALVLSGKSLGRGAREVIQSRQTLPTGPAIALINGRDAAGRVETISGDPGFDSSRGRIVIRMADGEQLAEIAGSSAAGSYGAAVAPAGDVDGDGIADFAVGAPGALASTGAAYIYSGADLSGKPLAMRIADASGDGLGSALSGAGDINGDGRDDVMAGAPQALQGRGVVHVFSGADVTGAPLVKKSGEVPGDAFGSAVAGVGDLDGDGTAEALIGAPNHGEGPHSKAGAVYVYSGADRLNASTLVLSGSSAGDNFGFSVSSACPDPSALGRKK